MRAAVEDNLELARSTQFAADSLAAAEQAIIAEAMRAQSRPSAPINGGLLEALESLESLRG
jgi:hypothetical protein